MTKFYDTFAPNKSSSSDNESKKTASITLQSLLEMAKDVSDQMILSKAKVNEEQIETLKDKVT